MVFLFLLVPAFVAQSPSSENSGAVAEALRRYEDALQVYSTCSFSATTKLYDNSSKLPGSLPRSEISNSVVRAGSRWKLRETVLHRHLEKDRVRVNYEEHETVYPAQGMYGVLIDPKTHAATSLLVLLRELSEAERNRVLGESFSPIVNGGLFWNEVSLLDTIKQSNPRVTKAELDGREMLLLEGDGEWGYHGIWLDPKHGFQPRRIVQRKDGRDRVCINPGVNKSLSSLPAEYGGPYQQFLQQVDSSMFELIQGKHVITAFSAASELKHKDGRSVGGQRRLVTFTQFNPTPDLSKDPFVLTTPIPNGTRVTVDDKRGIEHEWRDGKVVKRVNAETVNSVRGGVFQQDRLLGVGLLVLGLIAAVVVTLAFWLRYRAGLA